MIVYCSWFRIEIQSFKKDHMYLEDVTDIIDTDPSGSVFNLSLSICMIALHTLVIFML